MASKSPENADNQQQVFISYCNRKSDFAALVSLTLKHAGFKVWIDNASIPAGAEWRTEIDAGILCSDVIVILLDNDSAESSYVTYEWAFALGSDKCIVPVLVEDCKVHERINVLQFIDFRNNQRPWDKLIDRIKSVYSRGGEEKKIADLKVSDLEKILTAAIKLTYQKSESLASTVTQLASAKQHFNITPENPNLILWVDDHPNNNIAERGALETIGFKFELAKSTQEALSMFYVGKYEAIISDMGRVEGDTEGYVLLEEIRKQDKHIPYFIYAGSCAIKHKKEAKERGAQGTTNRLYELVTLITAHVQPQREEKYNGI